MTCEHIHSYRLQAASNVSTSTCRVEVSQSFMLSAPSLLSNLAQWEILALASFQRLTPYTPKSSVLVHLHQVLALKYKFWLSAESTAASPSCACSAWCSMGKKAAAETRAAACPQQKSFKVS